MQTMYFAGGCLWGVQAYMKTLPGVVETEAGRANGSTDTLDGPYDGYAECVRTVFDERVVSVPRLMGYFFEIIDPYSLNKQGIDVGKKYRTGVYSEDPRHLDEEGPSSKRATMRRGSSSRWSRCRGTSEVPTSIRTGSIDARTITAIFPPSCWPSTSELFPSARFACAWNGARPRVAELA